MGKQWVQNLNYNPLNKILTLLGSVLISKRDFVDALQLPLFTFFFSFSMYLEGIRGGVTFIFQNLNGVIEIS